MNPVIISTSITLIILASLFFYSCQSTNSKPTLEEIKEPTIKQLYERKHNIKIEHDDDYCFVKIRGMKGIYAIGSFAHDRGCKGNEIAVGKKIGPMNELMPEALKLLGWEETEKQEQLALSWVKNVMLVWESPQNSKNDSFEKEGVTFLAPKVEQVGEDWQVQIWVQEPAGMLPESNFYHLEVLIGQDAKVKSQKVLNRFTHSYH